MSDITKLAANAVRMGNISFAPKKVGTPNNIGGKRKYFAAQTQAYAQEAGEIADNTYEALCQGLDPNNWYEYQPVMIRANPSSVSSTGELMPDDWMRIHILKPAGLTYLSPGAYLSFAGNRWIVYKSYNMSVGLGQAIIRRCNAVVNKLDYYGNIIPIPMSYSKMGTLGNASHPTENSIIAKNYISCVCQYSEQSKDFAENTRLILGNSAYAMRGINNFTREFTDDVNSIHQMTFTIELTENLPQDDMVNGVADGLSFSWEINANAVGSMTVGGTQQITVKSLRNGSETVTTELYPIGYVYTSSNANVLTVSDSGLVTAVSAGTATITVSLAQNSNIKAEILVTVGAVSNGIYFTNHIESLKRFKSAKVSAAYVENGALTQNTVNFTFSGAESDCYSATLTGTNEYTITCYALATKPLTVTASYGTYSKSIDIDLTV